MKKKKETCLVESGQGLSLFAALGGAFSFFSSFTAGLRFHYSIHNERIILIEPESLNL